MALKDRSDGTMHRLAAWWKEESEGGERIGVAE